MALHHLIKAISPDIPALDTLASIDKDTLNQHLDDEVDIFCRNVDRHLIPRFTFIKNGLMGKTLYRRIVDNRTFGQDVDIPMLHFSLQDGIMEFSPDNTIGIHSIRIYIDTQAFDVTFMPSGSAHAFLASINKDRIDGYT